MKEIKYFGWLFILCCAISCGTISEVVEEDKKSAKDDLVEMSNKNNFGKDGPPEESKDGLFALINTSKGEIRIKLEYERAPVTVANFVALAEGDMKNSKTPIGIPFFDGLNFHRVISKSNGDGQDFMIQGGCPDGTGRGNPGYSFQDEFHPELKHDQPGTLSMANSGANTNGSQFFITVLPTPHLNNRHSVFGYTVGGQKIVMQYIKKGDKINSIVIERIGKDAKKFDAKKVFAESGIRVDR